MINDYSRKLFKQSQEAKLNKDYELENKLLKQSLEINPEDVKVINAYIRNLRHLCNKSELKIWLQKLYKLRPSGIILQELIQIAKSEGDKEFEEELLKERKKIEPKNKKVSRSLERIRKEKPKQEPILLLPIDYDTYICISNIRRSIIYREGTLESRKRELESIIFDMDPSIRLCLYSELYHYQSFSKLAIKYLKEYKKSLEDQDLKEQIKVLNKMNELLNNKKTTKGTWDYFWYSNITRKDMSFKKK